MKFETKSISFKMCFVMVDEKVLKSKKTSIINNKISINGLEKFNRM